MEEDIGLSLGLSKAELELLALAGGQVASITRRRLRTRSSADGADGIQSA
jgi:hypothetical protein